MKGFRDPGVMEGGRNEAARTQPLMQVTSSASSFRRCKTIGMVIVAIGAVLTTASVVIPRLLCGSVNIDAVDHLPITSVSEVESVELHFPMFGNAAQLFTKLETEEVMSILSRATTRRCLGWGDYWRRPHQPRLFSIKIHEKGGREMIVDIPGAKKMIGLRSSTIDSRYAGIWYDLAVEDGERLRSLCEIVSKREQAK